MRIVLDKYLDEYFLDLLFEPNDIDHIEHYEIPGAQIEINGNLVNIGVLLELPYLDKFVKD